MTETYRIQVGALSTEEGGGFLAWAPDLPGCMSDGESREEAEVNCRDAMQEWLDHARREGIDVPALVNPHAVTREERS